MLRCIYTYFTEVMWKIGWLAPPKKVIHLKYSKHWPCKTCLHSGFSMNSLLRHTVEHSTRLSFRPKLNNQSCSHLSKSWQKWQNSYFQSHFSTSKIIRIFLKKFLFEECYFKSTLFVINISWKLPSLKHFIF